MKRFLLIIVAILVLAATIWGIKADRDRRAERLRQEMQKPPEEVSVTFIEGWTNKQFAQAVSKNFDIPENDFLKALKRFDASSYSIISLRPKGTDLEGYLFPDTYRFFEEATSEAIIDKLLENFEDKFKQAVVGSRQVSGRYIIPGYEDVALDEVPGLTAHQVITLASILERETGRNTTNQTQLSEERKIVASIFYNRLETGVALQSDATINYITGKDDPSASAEDLDVDSPYNTYRHRGLPPGPIAAPSLSSLMAVLHPAETDYFYFLHKQPSGEPVYSKTFEEHKANKAKYLQ